MNENIRTDRTDVTLPMWKMIMSPLAGCSVPASYRPGRVLTRGHYAAPDPCSFDGLLAENLSELVGPGDIVYIPLYKGDSGVPGAGTSDRLSCYDHNLGVMQQIAGNVHAILLGNQGTELSFKHKWWGDRAAGAAEASKHAVAFIRETAQLVISAGGRPCYGTIDWDLMVDCLRGEQLIRQAALDCGALQVCYCADQLLRNTMPEGFHEDINGLLYKRGRADSFWGQLGLDEEDGPWYPNITDGRWVAFKEYLAPLDIIGSIGLPDENAFADRDDELLMEYGFTGGLCAEA